VAVRFFGLTQILLLVAILAGIFYQWKRSRDLRKTEGLNLDNIDLRSAIKRTSAPAGPKDGGYDQTKTAAAEIESAFPSWDAKTPPHEILGIASTASPDAVEAAYKRLLKRYHPDRFASWGPGYQKRAHHVVLLLQKAREKLSKG
jgi:DnaJ-domain-containing protein 1